MKTMRERPLQIYLRPEQDTALRYLAKVEKVSIAELVRRSVDRMLQDVPPDKDPLLGLIGIGNSGLHDLSENHDAYLVQIYEEESNSSRQQPRRVNKESRNKSNRRKKRPA